MKGKKIQMRELIPPEFSKCFWRFMKYEAMEKYLKPYSVLISQLQLVKFIKLEIFVSDYSQYKQNF